MNWRSGAGAREWGGGWRAAAAGTVGTCISFMPGAALGLMMKPLGDAYGWKRAQISSATLMLVAFLLLTGPLVGSLVDRWGPRWVACTGVMLFSAGLVGVSLAGPNIWTWYLSWAFMGLVYASVSSVVWTAAITRLFRSQRGLALSVALSGSGIGSFLSPLIAVRTLDMFGWKGTYLTYALGSALIGLPLIWFLLDETAMDRQDRAAHGSVSKLLEGLSRREILRSRQFWFLILAIIFVGAGIGTLSPHFLPLITDAGVARAKAAGYAAVIGPSLVVGRLVGGALLDRFPARFVVAVSFALPAVACAILLSFKGSPVLAVAAAIFIGMSYGAEGDMIAYITAQYFGRRHYAWAYAGIFAVFAFSYGFSTVAAGAVYDSLGSYHVMLMLLIVGLVAAVGIVASLGKPPRFAAIAP